LWDCTTMLADGTAFSPLPRPNAQRFFSCGDPAPCAGLGLTEEDRRRAARDGGRTSPGARSGLPHPFATPTVMRKPLAGSCQPTAHRLFFPTSDRQRIGSFLYLRADSASFRDRKRRHATLSHLTAAESGVSQE
jgi:hypothetical protein